MAGQHLNFSADGAKLFSALVSMLPLQMLSSHCINVRCMQQLFILIVIL